MGLFFYFFFFRETEFFRSFITVIQIQKFCSIREMFRRIASFICVTIYLFSITSGEAADPLGPGQGPWAVETPESHSLDPQLLENARDEVFKIKGRNCLVVIKDGALVYESYGGFFKSPDASHQGYSMTKTIGALIVGRAAQEGKLDIDSDITKKYGVKSPKPYPVTTRQIMSQSIAGSKGPGEEWEYDAVGTHWVNTLPKIVAAAAGEKSSSIWQRAFHVPLGLAKSFEFTFPGIDEVFAFRYMLSFTLYLSNK